MRLTVVLPTYNEADNLRPMVEALLNLDLGAFDVRQDILVVDDDSPDGTGVLADELAAAYPSRLAVHHRAAKQGLAHAYLDGFARALESGAGLVVQMDCDFSHQPGDIARLLGALDAADVVLGSRFSKGGSVDPTWSWYRKLLSGWANRVYVPMILGLPLCDATGGFRLWRAEALRSVADPRIIGCNGYAFQVEMAYVAHTMGFRMHEVPIFFPDRERGDSKMSLSIQVESAWQVPAMRIRHRKRKASR
jgi:dolichol-phosphate mannosyltransferase